MTHFSQKFNIILARVVYKIYYLAVATSNWNLVVLGPLSYSPRILKDCDGILIYTETDDCSITTQSMTMLQKQRSVAAM